MELIESSRIAGILRKTPGAQRFEPGTRVFVDGRAWDLVARSSRPPFKALLRRGEEAAIAPWERLEGAPKPSLEEAAASLAKTFKGIVLTSEQEPIQ